jgi:hypothetical protein
VGYQAKPRWRLRPKSLSNGGFESSTLGFGSVFVAFATASAASALVFRSVCLGLEVDVEVAVGAGSVRGLLVKVLVRSRFSSLGYLRRVWGEGKKAGGRKGGRDNPNS